MLGNSNKTEREKDREAVKIIDLATVKEYADGAVIELPPFSAGQPFVARVRRPSMLRMVSDGTFSNPLLETVNILFNGDDEDRKKQTENPENMKNMYSVLETLAESMLVEPTVEQLHEKGLELTDEQLMFLYMYQQRGALVLKSFRK